MNLSDFKHDLVREFGISQNQSRKVLSFLQTKVRERILFGEQITLREIGTLQLRIRLPKKFKHLKTGKMEMSKKCYYLDFKASGKIAEELKNKTVY